MIRAFRSEWRKLRRPGILLGGAGTMVAFAPLVTIILFSVSVDKNPSQFTADEARTGAIPFAALEAEGGLTYAFSASASVLGIVALVLAAQNVGHEYSLGTLKVLLSREPRRMRLLAGKLSALAVLVLAAVIVAFACSIVVASVMALVRGVSMDLWWTAHGMGQALLGLLRTIGTTMVWGLIGALLAILLRASTPAVGIGIGYTIVAEGIFSLAVKGASKYLPGRSLTALANWGGAPPGQPPGLDGPTALLVVAAYTVVFTSVACVVFARRDVSS